MPRWRMQPTPEGAGGSGGEALSYGAARPLRVCMHGFLPPRYELLRGVALALGLLGALGSCAPQDNPYEPYPEPDLESFRLDVQPMLRLECATSGCHGTHQRALTLFSVDGLRAEPSAAQGAIDPDELSEAELGWNYDAMRMRLRGEQDADEAELLLKCLAPSAGGIVHSDWLVVFEDREEPGYVVLRDWIETGL